MSVNEEPTLVESAVETEVSNVQDAIKSLGLGEPEEAQEEPQGEDSEDSEESVEEPEEAEEEEQEEPGGEAEAESSPQLQVIAKQEERLRELNQAFKQEKEDFRKEHEDLQRQLDEFNSLKGSGSAADVLKRLGFDNLAAVAEELYLHEMGDDAPPELASGHKQSVLAREVEELKRRIADNEKAAEEKQQSAVAEKRVSQYVDSLAEHFQGLSDEHKYLQVAVAGDPEGTIRNAWDIASEMFDESQEIPTPRQVAEVLDEAIKEEFARYREIEGTAAAKEKDENDTSKKKKKTRTLSSKRTAPKQNYSKTTAELSDDEMLERAQAAVEAQLANS
jgi:hypothetical protein